MIEKHYIVCCLFTDKLPNLTMGEYNSLVIQFSSEDCEMHWRVTVVNLDVTIFSLFFEVIASTEVTAITNREYLTKIMSFSRIVINNKTRFRDTSLVRRHNKLNSVKSLELTYKHDHKT